MKMKSALLILPFILVETAIAQFDRSAVENDLKYFKHNEINKNRWYWRPPFLNQNSFYYNYGALANPFFTWLVPFSNYKIQNNPGIISTYNVKNSLEKTTFKDSDVCLTLSSHGPNREKPCQFPFKYKGKEYSTCTKKDWSSFWCATELKLDGSYRKFGYCNENCPKECGKPNRKGDGWCDDDNNHNGCEFDGGDCCCGNKNYCSKCECLIQVNCLDNTTASSIISPIATTSTSSPPTALEYGGPYKIVCYFGGWSIYRKDPMRFGPKDIDPGMCTHLIYSFAGLDNQTLEIVSLDPGADIDEGGYRNVIALKEKNPDLKVMLAVGGWVEGVEKYSKMASTKENRNNFIESVVDFLTLHNFDGLDMDWEYPGDTGRGGSYSDKENYVNLLDELRSEFDKHDWLLSAAVPAPKSRIDPGYNVPRISKALDFINIMNYDMHGVWEGHADHHAKLFKRENDYYPYNSLNVDYAMNYWHQKGAPKHKLILGVPFYGRTFLLKNPSINQPGPKAKSLSESFEGEFTEEQGFLSYFEICKLRTDPGWIQKKDTSGNDYMYKDDKWIGYDTKEAIERKMNYIRANQFGGGMIWAIDLDDFNGQCGEEWPLLSTMNTVLKSNDPIPEELQQSASQNTNVDIVSAKVDFNCSSSGLFASPKDCSIYYQCSPDGTAYEQKCASGLHFNSQTKICDWPDNVKCQSPPKKWPFVVSPQTYSNTNAHAYKNVEKSKNVICYFANWAQLRASNGKFVPENIDSRPCSHVFYAYANLDSVSFEVTPGNPLVDINDGYYNRIQTAAKLQNPNVKILLALGGWTDSSGDKYSKLVNNPSKRANFVSKTVKTLKTRQFDGLSLEWQYPVCWQSDCNAGNAKDKQGFSKLVKELKTAFAAEGLILAMSVSGYTDIADKSYDLNIIGKHVDIVNVMSYDYHGYWDGRTNHHSPLNLVPNSNYPTYFVEHAMEYYTKKGIPINKLNMGIPFYGQTYTLKSSYNNQLKAPTTGPGKAGQSSLQPGFLTYFEICQNVKNNGWTTNSNSNFGAYATKNDQWASYNDIQTVQKKANYILKKNYGGAALYFIDTDDFNNNCCHGQSPLTNTVGNILRGIGKLTEGNCQRPPAVTTPAPPEVTTGFDDGGRFTTKPWKPAATTTTPRTTTATWKPAPPLPISPPSSSSGVEDLKIGTFCKQEGQTFVHSDCGKYYRCANKKIIVQQCGLGLFWSNSKGRCDWPKNVNCGTRSVAATIATTTTTTTTITTPTSSFKLPQSCTPGEYQAVPDECSAFISCNTQGVPQKSYCSPGLHWVQRSLSCNWAKDSGCLSADEEESNTIQAAFYTIGTACTPGEEGTIVPNSLECSSFLICNHDKFVEVSCPTGLHFDSKLNACNTPELAQCVQGVLESPSNDLSSSIINTDEEDYELNPDDFENDTEGLEELGSRKGASRRKKVVCYFTNWAFYRPNQGKYKPENIKPNLCTHIIYGFATLNPKSLKIRAHDSWADISEPNEFYKKVTELKSQNRKVLLAIGGWNDSKGNKYSRLVNNPKARKDFIQHVIEYLKKHNFDGLDLDWEYPKCWQVDCKAGPASDKEAFANWVRELSIALHKENMLLSSAVSPSAKVCDHAYDIPKLNKYLDFVNVMTYDYHGQWDKKTGHIAPIYEHPEDTDKTFNVNYTINYWLEKGLHPSKLILGLPLYGQSFTLAKRSENGLNSKTYGGANAGKFTRSRGFLSYYEICDKVKNKDWTVVRDPQKRMGPYAYKNSEWVSFDDIDTIGQKIEILKDYKLGGAMIWALDLDDFNGQCSPTEYPLLKTINLKLGRISKFKPPKPLVTNKKQNTKTIGSKFIVPYPGFFYYYPWNYYLQYQQKNYFV